jgi:hypothetical protein
MTAAERKKLVQMYGVGDSSKAAGPICGVCLALLVLVVVLGSPSQGDDYAQSPRPTFTAAARGDPLGARSDPYGKQTFEARRVAFDRR